MNREEELILKCKRGHTAAYKDLYNEHSVEVYNTILRLVKHTAEAEDVLQESFVSAFRQLDKFVPQNGFRAWVRRIAINKSIDLIRKRKINFVELKPHLVPAQEEIIDETGYQFKIDAIMAAIELLPESYRTIFNLYVIEDISQAEIALLLGLENTTVRVQYHRAKQKLLFILNKEKYHG